MLRRVGPQPDPLDRHPRRHHSRARIDRRPHRAHAPHRRPRPTRQPLRHTNPAPAHPMALAYRVHTSIDPAARAHLRARIVARPADRRAAQPPPSADTPNPRQHPNTPTPLTRRCEPQTPRSAPTTSPHRSEPATTIAPTQTVDRGSAARVGSRRGRVRSQLIALIVRWDTGERLCDNDLDAIASVGVAPPNQGSCRR